ILSALVGIV
nr:Chain C, GP2 PEPTIDE [synthetic construct]1EEY_F Chain F, GP2 PEPTIDE [synthetic construct]